MPATLKSSKSETDSPVERLLASIAELRQRPSSKTAHLYRTSFRRFHAWSAVFRPSLDDQQDKAFKFLDKLRKATGKLRDAGIHLDLLKQLDRDDRAQKKLRKALKSRRDFSKKRLKKLLRDPGLTNLLPMIRAVDQQPAQTPESVNAQGSVTMAALALQEYRAFVLRRGKLTAENLHEYRLACKGFRYTAELAGEDRKAQELAKVWKGVQDVIGKWHDYLTLTEVAEKVLGNSRLQALLEQRTAKNYRESLRAVERAERKLAEPEAVPKKEPEAARAGGRTPVSASA
jgi:CHAD domain-containing protein